VLQQCRPHRIRVCLPPTGRTLNIGEQKRHDPRRRVPRGHPHRMSHKALFNAAIVTNFRDSRNSQGLFRDRVDGTHAEAPAPLRRRGQAVREVLAPILTFVSFMTSR
jgi:hypothetical protein